MSARGPKPRFSPWRENDERANSPGRSLANQLPVISMRPYLLVALGSALGGMARLGCALAAELLWGTAFPYGTLLVNVLGSFLIGFIFTATDEQTGRFPTGPDFRIFCMTGICGGYTTFSSFSLQTFTLLRDGHGLAAGTNVLASVALCLLAVWLGQLAGIALGSAAR